MLACSAHLFITYLFLIYLFKAYLSFYLYLLTAGTWGSFLLRGRGGWVSPAHFGSANGEGCSWAPRSHPIPLWEGGRAGEEESHECLQGGHPMPGLFLQDLEAPSSPSGAALLPVPICIYWPGLLVFFCLAHAVLDVANFWRW